MLTAVGALVSVAALAAVVIWALHQDAPTLPSSAADLTALGAAIAVYLAACAARGERWMALLRHNGAQPHRADAYSLVAVGYMGNNVLPARAGDALRVLFLTPRARTDARTVIGTLVAERVLDVVILLGLFLVLSYGVVSGVSVPSGGRLAFAAVLVAVLLAVGALVALVLHRRGDLRGVLVFLAPMAAATRRLHGRHGAEVLAWSLLVWGLEWAAWWAAAEAAGLGVSVLETGYLLGVASIFVLIPSGPAFAGTLDAAIIFGARALERSGAAALSYVLLLRFVLIVPITLLGLALLVGRYGGLGRLRAVARA
ncbi:MAG: flippase-like domain-containing protein [Solirubrobacterales bacterium]|nr:flippase-like domain-containing protein [Solirubrobacterales bacterium]